MAAFQLTPHGLDVAYCFIKPFFELSLEILGQDRIEGGGGEMFLCRDLHCDRHAVANRYTDYAIRAVHYAQYCPNYENVILCRRNGLFILSSFPYYSR